MKSAGNQGFAIWVYRALMPTVYDRYDIDRLPQPLRLRPTAASARGGARASTASPHPQPDGPQEQTGTGASQPVCRTTEPVVPRLRSSHALYDLAPTSPEPDLESAPPGRTAWNSRASRRRPGPSAARPGTTVHTSVAENSWQFPNYGNPVPQRRQRGQTVGGAGRSQARPRAPIRLGRPRPGGGGRCAAARGCGRGRHRFRAGAAGGRDGEGRAAAVRARAWRAHATARRRAAAAEVTLRRVAAAALGRRRRARRRVRVALRRGRGGRASLTLTSARLFHRRARATPCRRRWRATTPPLWLHSRLVIGDGRPRRVSAAHHLRCRATRAATSAGSACPLPPPRRGPGLARDAARPAPRAAGNDGPVRRARAQPPPWRRPAGLVAVGRGSTAASARCEIRELRAGRSRRLTVHPPGAAYRARTLLRPGRRRRPRRAAARGPRLRAGPSRPPAQVHRLTVVYGSWPPGSPVATSESPCSAAGWCPGIPLRRRRYACALRRSDRPTRRRAALTATTGVR